MVEMNYADNVNKVFYTQARLLCNDFKSMQEFRQSISKNYVPIPVGSESAKLAGALLVLGMETQEIENHTAYRTNFGPVSLNDPMYETIMGDNQHTDSDRARIFKGDSVSMDALIVDMVRPARKKIPGLIGEADINESFYVKLLSTAKKENKESMRTLTALCTSVGLGLPVVISSQTVRPQSDYDVDDVYFDFTYHEKRKRTFSRVGTGRVLQFGETGLEKEVYLEVREGVDSSEVIGWIPVTEDKHDVYPVVLVERKFSYSDKEKAVLFSSENVVSRVLLDELAR